MNQELVQNLLAFGLATAWIAALIIITLRFGLPGLKSSLTTLRADIPDLNRIEGALTTIVPQSQLDHFRQVAFPIFALGLAITPQGDPKDVLAQAKQLFDMLTDGQPNVPPDTNAAADAKGG